MCSSLNAGQVNDTLGNPHRAQISQFELFELILLLKSDKRLPVEQFEATVAQSTVPSPPSYLWADGDLLGHGPEGLRLLVDPYLGQRG